MTPIASFLANAGLQNATSDIQSGSPSHQGAGIPGAQPVGSLEKFNNAMYQAENSNAVVALNQPAPPVADLRGPFSLQSNIQQVDQPSTASATVKTYADMDAEALAAENERATQGVQFGKHVPAADEGNSVAGHQGSLVFDGLSSLRHAFDGQIGRVNDISAQSINGTEKMIATQMEMTRFSLLVDVTSKLTGKSTQVLDTLLKGQ